MRRTGRYATSCAPRAWRSHRGSMTSHSPAGSSTGLGRQNPAAAAYDAALAWWYGPDPDLLRPPPPVPILGHRDPNLTNYLWDGHRVRIVDFEDAAISDPATELAILVEHLSARHLDTNALLAHFDVDGRRLQAARRLWAMFWLWLLRPGGPAGHRNPPGTAGAQAQRLLNLLDTD